MMLNSVGVMKLSMCIRRIGLIGGGQTIVEVQIECVVFLSYSDCLISTLRKKNLGLTISEISFLI